MVEVPKLLDFALSMNHRYGWWDTMLNLSAG